MRKILALVLSLALLLGCAAALAEAAEKEYSGELTIDERFTIKWIAPDGYEMTDLFSGNPGTMICQLAPNEENAGKPVMYMSVAYNELYADVDRINDLDADALAAIEASFREEDEVEITYMETAYGTKLMVVQETEDGVDFVDFYTVYKGYEIEFILTQSPEKPGEPITEEQIQTVIQFLSDVDFVPVEAD